MPAVSWTEMVNQVVIAGRPGDVEDAALGWEDVLGNIRDVCSTLERDVKGIDAFWTGEAADAFTKKVGDLSKQLKGIVDSAAPEGGTGIVETLRGAAQDLQRAQAAMPIPATKLGDVMAARDARAYIGSGSLEIELESSFFNSLPVKAVGWATDQFRSLLSDVEDDAKRAYDQVDSEHEGHADRTPQTVMPYGDNSTTITPPNLTTHDPTGGGGKVPDLSNIGGGGGTSKLPGGGSSGVGNMPGLLDGSPVGGPSTPGFDDDFKPGSGLAGAGGGLTTAPGLGGAGGGLGSGAGLGGLGGGAGLGSGGAGIGAPGAGLGRIPGGGSLGKPITPGLGAMGGLAGGGGRGGAGKLGGGMAGLGGAGRGSGTAGGRGAGGGMAGIGGVGGGAGAGKGGGARAAGGVKGGGLGGVAGGAGGAGRPGGGARGGAAGRGAGMMGAGGAGHGTGDEEEYDSWLYEDDNVWNEGTDVPPPGVLGT